MIYKIIRFAKNFVAIKLQKSVLYFADIIFSFSIFKPKKDKSFVIGVHEVASILKNLSLALPQSISVAFNWHPFYHFKYTYSSFYALPFIPKSVVDFFYKPILLAFLEKKTDNFLYIWSKGFLDFDDGRAFEFAFLKKRGKKIICFFCGNDIRSITLEKQLGRELQMDVAGNYYKYFLPDLDSPRWEKKVKSLASVTEKYADLILNFPTDQKSYIQKDVFPFHYLMEDSKFIFCPEKFQNLAFEKLLILHCPSSPIIKGTQIVRAAIKRLYNEGFIFDYQELENVPNDQVLESLKKAHVVLNEFYMFSPGVFGIEALANTCVLLTSADRNIEKLLPNGCEDAWISTKYFEVYENIRWCLLNKEKLKEQGIRGYKWAWENASISKNGQKFNDFLMSKGIITQISAI